MPEVTLLLITVRPDYGYSEKPEWHTIGKVIEDLNNQTYKDFELVVVDGVGGREDIASSANFPCKIVKPKVNLWTRNKKVAICAYRNTGLAHARGKLVINLDDCCELPQEYVEVFAKCYFRYNVCISATWPETGDNRVAHSVIARGELEISRNPCIPGSVFGFGSYPLELAINLNGYDEAYDGAMYLEDADWSHRLIRNGLEMRFAYIPGFRLHPQSAHHPDAIDTSEPIVKCCNCAWQAQRCWRDVSEANRDHLWTTEALERLIGPCRLLNDEMCMHHVPPNRCAYIDSGFARECHALAAKIFDEPPVIDLEMERKINGL